MQRSSTVETNCVVAEYRIKYRIGPHSIITHAHRAPLIDGLGHATWTATQAIVATSHKLASCVVVSGFRAALDLDTYPLRNLIRPRCAERAKPGRGKPVLIMHIGFFACFHISRTQSFQKNRHILFLALVAQKLLVLLISRLVACSARIVVDRHTHRQTDRQTHTERLL